jgi:hypothetical protein
MTDLFIPIVDSRGHLCRRRSVCSAPSQTALARPLIAIGFDDTLGVFIPEGWQ